MLAMSLQSGKFGFTCIVVLVLSLHGTMYNSEKVDYYTFIAEVGTSVTLRCQTKRGNDSTAEWGNDTGSSTVKLCKMGEKCSSDSVEANFSSGTYSLIIKNVTSEMNGTYKCDDDGELVAARLIVVDSIKSESQEPIKGIRYDSFLELNKCSIKHDTVKLQCAISFMDNCDHCSPLHVKSDNEDDSKSDNEYFSIPIKDVHSMKKTLCEHWFKINGVNSEFTHSVPINITCSNGSVSAVDPDQQFVHCSGFNQSSCTYFWMNENMTIVSNNKQLDLNRKPEGIYSCIVNCSSHAHGTYCPFVAKQIQCTCKEDDDNSDTYLSPVQHKLIGENLKTVYSSIAGSVVLGVLLFVTGIILWRFCRKKKISEESKTTDGATGELIRR